MSEAVEWRPRAETNIKYSINPLTVGGFQFCKISGLMFQSRSDQYNSRLRSEGRWIKYLLEIKHFSAHNFATYKGIIT